MSTTDGASEDRRSLMRRAIELAERAGDAGEVPVGSVVVCDGEVVAEGLNRRESWQDPSAHAELIAMRRASDALGTWRLEECSVYVTLEPCPMCAGALVNARVSELVFGARDPKAGAVRSLYELLDDERFNHEVDVVESELADVCGDLLTDFFEAVRDGRAPAKPSGDSTDH